MLLVNATHKGGSRRQDLIHEDEDGLLGGQLDPLADDVDKLANGQVGRDQVLLLVDGSDVALLDLFADDLHDAPSVVEVQIDDSEYPGWQGVDGGEAPRNSE